MRPRKGSARRPLLASSAPSASVVGLRLREDEHEVDQPSEGHMKREPWGAEPDAIRRSGQRIQQTAQTMLNALGIDAEGAQ